MTTRHDIIKYSKAAKSNKVFDPLRVRKVYNYPFYN